MRLGSEGGVGKPVPAQGEAKNEPPFDVPVIRVVPAKTPAAQPAPTLPLREQLVRAEIAAAKLGIHETGGDNHGPWVKKFLAEVGLPEGYAWCDAFQSYEEHGVAGKRLPIESASVGQTYAAAEHLGWAVNTPARGDLVCYSWSAPGPPFADHIGLVLAAANDGSAWRLETIEGNTSSGNAGSQGNGDGVYLRTRVMPKNMVGFVRIPG